MPNLLVYASGYPPYYRQNRCGGCRERRLTGWCDCAEVEASEYRRDGRPGDIANPDQNWWPRTADFLAAARRFAQGRGDHVRGASNVLQFRRAFQGIRPHSLQKACFFGHGRSGEIQFGRDKLDQSNVDQLSSVSRVFSTGGYLELYACTTSLGSDFLQVLADRLEIEVRGFTFGVRWTFRWEGDPNPSCCRRIVERASGTFPRPDVSARPNPIQTGL